MRGSCVDEGAPKLQVCARFLDKEQWCQLYTPYFSCADWRYAGTLTLFKKTLRKPEKFFFNLDLEEGGRHDSNGRVCIAQYSTGLRVANFYAPNNGYNEEKNFISRRAWDASLLGFVKRTQREQRQLVIIGDLNVAHQRSDVSHPHWFLAQGEKVRAFGKAAKMPTHHVTTSDYGQAGFTPNEQLRFGKVLEDGGLIDTFRELHPEGVGPDIDDANWYTYPHSCLLLYSFLFQYIGGHWRCQLIHLNRLSCALILFIFF